MCKAGASSRVLVTAGAHHPTIMYYQQLTKVTMVLAGLRCGVREVPGLIRLRQDRPGFQLETGRGGVHNLRLGAQFA